MHSNFVTPPDFVSDPLHTILLVDATPEELERVAMICKVIGTDFNVYAYRADMQNVEWLLEAALRADVIIVNTDPSDCSTLKDRLANRPNAYYYGSKNFLDNDRRIGNPQEYIIKYVGQQSTAPAL